MPDERPGAEIYRDWREARQHLKEAPRGSPEATRLRDEMERLRLEYVALTEESRRRIRPRPEA